MNKLFQQRINQLARSGDRSCLWGGLKGIEKESLRVDANGGLSTRPHPRTLGSPLTNRYITTDFSEALLEFVTPALPSTWEVLRFLCDLHQFSYERMDGELLWVTSMPCRIPPDGEIPLARYGSSNVGRMKTVYRNGLGFRYGRTMQTIAGIHFNYSLPSSFWPLYREIEQFTGGHDAFKSAAYLDLVRNFRRFGWLILYLFGASPAVCKSFSTGPAANLPSFDEHTLYEPFATSLRMSDLGYSNKTQAGLNISVNSLDDYISDLSRAITTPDAAYERIGVKVDGEYRQLSSSQLQIENEYYSSIRPKRVAMSGERPTAALKRGGIEYVEIRSLDLNAFDPVGINQHAMRFVEAFLVYCMLMDSPKLDDKGWQEATANHGAAAKRGRDPELMLQRNGKPVRLRDWAREIVDDVRIVAELIDQGC
ncbi:MAG TPA: glutamate--cysteine ligase, partial [Woeseiaceae bacterium]|nr:glutamate--cysteine ligase [Woeseiaceae bacterium]